MKYLKLLIRNILAGLGYSISNSTHKAKVLCNVFNTTYNRTALVSYIQNVFEDARNQADERHTNRLTTAIIAETLRDLGYNVDVINYSDDIEDRFNTYDIVIGLGKSLDSVLSKRSSSKKPKVIWFGTGCNPLFSNTATIKRVDDFYKKHGKIVLTSSRYIKEDWVLQHEFADWIILHGSTFSRSTYRKENISSIHAPVFIKHNITRTDNEWATAKQNFIWFGSNGAIHKGLDLVIDAFTERKDCTLHICGDIENEVDFFKLYSPLIKSSSNIKYHGFVNVESDSFKKILQSCAFVIYPSASEGNSPAVLTCMANGGLVPVVSKNADIDLNGYGILIDELTIESVSSAVQKSQDLSVSELKAQSKLVLKETTRFNSFNYFKEDFKLKLQEAIKTI
ncbi:MAG TPA: glycosyltransferase [Bacteroidia bacterium]|nr:glycosyltransferase [Bacteroidia bacterium]